jgi:hypothetical protein
VLAYYRRHAGNKSGDRVAAARALVRILTDLRSTATLTAPQRAHLDRVIARRTAAVARRELEARWLAGDLRGARRAFWSIRQGFADRRKYALALALVLASPALYVRTVLARES